MVQGFAFRTKRRRQGLIIGEDFILLGLFILAAIILVSFLLPLTLVENNRVEDAIVAWNLSRGVEYSAAAELTDRIDPGVTNSTDLQKQGVMPGTAAQSSWWNNAYHYRVPIEVKANGYERYNKPVEALLNFTQLLTALGKSGVLDLNSIHVVEVDAQGAVLNEIGFQFDQAVDYNASTKAKGTLIFLLQGTTPANASRYFYLYFDTTANGPFVPLVVSPQITMTDNISHEGELSFKIQTQNATYYYHKQGAGFASMEDQQGIDWIGFHPDPGSRSAGEFRGIPNLGDFAHPGYTNSTSSLSSQGPLKAILHSETTDGSGELIWEMYPYYAKMTLLKKGANPYWFLYEGTPNGQLDLVKDFVVRSTGVKTDASTSWEGDIPAPEWVYFGDSDVNRVIFQAHHEDDSIVDSYRQMENNMTVFGFGRKLTGTTRFLTQVPAHFTIGFAESSTSAPNVINSAFRDLVVLLGQPEALPPPGPDPTPDLDTLLFLPLIIK
ncbi:MAG: hypothetical protein HYR94_07330 [Chloroflexi bacterium]|nr:hypothetical protein [Chloroflexota bacterium]